MVDTATAARVNRLTGRDGRGGGGLPLPDLWDAILRPLLDSPTPLPDEVLLESVKNHEFLSRKLARIQTIYKDSDPWILLFDDAISQLHQRKLIATAEPRGWKLGSAFKPSTSLVVIPAARGHDAATVTVRSSAEHAAGRPAAMEKMGITELAGKLSTSRGFRVPDPAHVLKLVRSIEAIGWRSELGLILIDQHSRILDGAHRLEALRQLGTYDTELEDSKQRKLFFQDVVVADDREALGIVWAANLKSMWSSGDVQYFTEVLGGDPFSVLNPHERARAALQADANRTDREVAKEVGASRETVNRARRKLEAEGVDVRTPIQRKKAEAEALKAANPEMSDREAARQAGVGSHNTVRAAAEKSGQSGSEVTKIDQPKKPRQPSKTQNPELQQELRRRLVEEDGKGLEARELADRFDLSPSSLHTAARQARTEYERGQSRSAPPVFTSETPVQPDPKPKAKRQQPRLEDALEDARVNDADYLVEFLDGHVPDTHVLADLVQKLAKLVEQRGGV